MYSIPTARMDCGWPCCSVLSYYYNVICGAVVSDHQLWVNVDNTQQVAFPQLLQQNDNVQILSWLLLGIRLF